MTKKTSKDLESSTKCYICDNTLFDGDVKVRDHCHITENIQVVHIETEI